MFPNLVGHLLLLNGPTEEEGIAFAPDGNSIVTAVGIQRSSVWLHDSHGDRVLTSEATAALSDSHNGGPFSLDCVSKSHRWLHARCNGYTIELRLWVGGCRFVT